MGKKIKAHGGKGGAGQNRTNPAKERLLAGQAMVERHPLFSALWDAVWLRSAQERPGSAGESVHTKKSNGKSEVKEPCAWIGADGHLWIDEKKRMKPEQWAFIIAHCLLHLAFGHFDKEKMPQEPDGIDSLLWNCACDLYIYKFLIDMKFATPPVSIQIAAFGGIMQDERQIYRALKEHRIAEDFLSAGTAGRGELDMVGLSQPKVYTGNQYNRYAAIFGRSLAYSVSDAVSVAGGHGRLAASESAAQQAASWFLSSYPLLGGLAAAFRIIEDYQLCRQEDISIAAVNAEEGEIYINPARKLSREELQFVMAHEYLHAGLLHHRRAQGRDPYLWNVACDFVINEWLVDMGIGVMPPEGLLYDQKLSGKSAEEIYDNMLRDLRAFQKCDTFRGRGQGDIIKKRRSASASGGGVFDKNTVGNGIAGSTVDLDEFYRTALSQGLELHRQQERGLLPAGLTEEIQALSVPSIPWEVRLAEWFDQYIGPLHRIRTYGRASRRQSATPDIPRPGVMPYDSQNEGRTFGVVIDTSGSMDTHLLGKALGAVASYAASKEVPYVRVVFCDAAAYDAGYLSPEEIAGRIRVKGRGGTVLQPGVDLLLQAEDFPKKGPILLITDGGCEPRVSVSREHAWLLPAGRCLPFRDKGKLFYFN